MIEIIKRKEGFKSEKERLGGRVQISYNSDGKICIRQIESPVQDNLIVLDAWATKELMRFCKNIIEGLNPMPF